MKNNFKYVFNGKEKSKEQFIKLAKDSFKWFSDDTIQAVDFDSVSSFFSGDYKTDNEIDKHFKGVLNDKVNKVIEVNDKFILDELKKSNKVSADGLWNMLNTANPLKKEYPNLGDYLNKEQEIFEDWNKKDYNTQTVRVNSSPEDLVKLNILKNCVLNKDFKSNSLEDIANLISAEKTGIKESNNKTDYSEINLEILDLMAERFLNNKHKYPRGNMKKPIDIKSLEWALFRHIKKMIQPMENDPETYEDHLAAILCNASMIVDQKNINKN